MPDGPLPSLTISPASRCARMVLLIDFENINQIDLIRSALQWARKFGDIGVLRAYGAFGASRAAPDALQEMGIEPIHRCLVSAQRRKNAADIAMTVAAMDMLHSGRVDGFVIGSSDSDFTPLARRIRDCGLPVYGFGEGSKCPVAYKKAFTDFYVRKSQPTPVVSAKAGSAT